MDLINSKVWSKTEFNNMMTKNTLFITLSLLLFVGLGLSAQKKEDKFKRGGGSFEFTEYEALKDQPITLYYYIPTRGNIKKMRILFSMHGAERSGLTQRGAWRNLAEDYGFIVLAPEFTHQNNYKENDYQFGGVSEDPADFIMRPREKWTYQMIEAIFDYFKESTGNTSEVYDMFGHSAGGQFVHRYLLAMPEARVGRVVAANPGNYAYPDEKGLFSPSGELADPPSWPFSIKDTPFTTDEYLSAFFKRDLVILIGSEDTEPLGPGMADNHPIKIQGINRYERAWKFFNASRTIALKKGYQFNWSIMEVPGAGHSSGQMIYGQGSVRNWRINGNERVFNIKDLTNKGAFSLIYEQ